MLEEAGGLERGTGAEGLVTGRVQLGVSNRLGDPYLLPQGWGCGAAMAPPVSPPQFRLLPFPLSASQLRRLEEHRYNSQGRSLLEPPLQVYWEWLLHWVPLWVAPNTITIAGLLLNVLTTLLLVYWCPTATEKAPSWVFLLCAAGLFIYQSLDAIDGKQARRTNSSSPLGELFDHGCDAISTVFVSVGLTVASRLGTNPDWLFFCNFIGIFLFFCAHWQTYVSGTLRFGKVDVSEAQMGIICVYLLSAFGGTTVWDIEIPMTGLPLKTVPIIATLGGALYSCSNYFMVIFTGGVGKNGSTVAGTSVLSPGLHIGLVITMALMIYKKSTTELFERHPCLYTLTFGFVCAKIANKLVVAHMTKSEIFIQDSALIGPGLLFLNQYFNGFINEYFVLWLALILSLVDLVRYCAGVCQQIAVHLRIRVFSIPPVPATQQVESHND